MIKQPDSEVIVVDYGCNQNTAEWVKNNYSEVKIIKVTDAEEFHLTRARNIGAANATGEWLLFIDADIILIGTMLTRWLKMNKKDEIFFIVDKVGDSKTGTCICSRQDFDYVGGYDEVFTKWGCEDLEFYERLMLHDIKMKLYPNNLIDFIDHDDILRQLDLGNKDLQNRRGKIYRSIMKDIFQITGKRIPYNQRKAIMSRLDDKIQEQLNSNNSDKANITISLQINNRLKSKTYKF